ncbi:MAG: hypothetical protein ACJ8AT_33305 [Hyalangium sp.]|uniref:hypothetical protein n=1 Tax=Hyalangium sp. TaxID=2028555 RepID=UPI00389AE4BC
MDDFQSLVLKWLDGQMKQYQKAIEQRKAEYLKKKWAWSEKAVSDFNRRLEELSAVHSSLLTELSFGKAHGQNLLNLANIIFNEAGTKNRAAKLAVAYAWLNRTKGVMREPKNKAEISHYVPLLQRWNNLTDGQRLSFLQNFAPSLNAARQRLSDKATAKNDPTRGATHWVSPTALDPFKNQDDYYARTLGTATNRAFPVWARGNSDSEVAKMKKSGMLKENYAELTLPGIDQTDFLFYVGVVY